MIEIRWSPKSGDAPATVCDAVGVKGGTGDGVGVKGGTASGVGVKARPIALVGKVPGRARWATRSAWRKHFEHGPDQVSVYDVSRR